MATAGTTSQCSPQVITSAARDLEPEPPRTARASRFDRAAHPGTVGFYDEL